MWYPLDISSVWIGNHPRQWHVKHSVYAEVLPDARHGVGQLALQTSIRRLASFLVKGRLTDSSRKRSVADWPIMHQMVKEKTKCGRRSMPTGNPIN